MTAGAAFRGNACCVRCLDDAHCKHIVQCRDAIEFVPSAVEIFPDAVELKRQGKVRFIGISELFSRIQWQVR